MNKKLNKELNSWVEVFFSLLTKMNLIKVVLHELNCNHIYFIITIKNTIIIKFIFNWILKTDVNKQFIMTVKLYNVSIFLCT